MYRPMVETMPLNGMLCCYHQEFEVYSRGRKKVNQLITTMVWSRMWNDYKKSYPTNELAEETLKNKSHEKLKNIDFGNANDDHWGGGRGVHTIKCDNGVNLSFRWPC